MDGFSRNFRRFVGLMGGQKYTKFHQHRTMYVKMVAKILLAFFADGTVAEPEFLKNCNRYHKIVLGHHKGEGKLPPDQI